MVAPAVDGIDLFKIAGRSISGWIPSLKAGTDSPIRQPFCSQLEERLLLWLEYNPQVVSYARGMPRLCKHAHPRTAWQGAAVQVSRQTQNEYSQY